MTQSAKKGSHGIFLILLQDWYQLTNFERHLFVCIFLLRMLDGASRDRK